MTFTTLTFLIFLPIVFGLYWAIRNRTAQNLLLIVCSYFFYGWWDPRFCLLMLAASLVDFAVALSFGRIQSAKKRKALLIASLSFNLGMLGYFKYFNFFADSFQTLCASLGWHVDPITLRIVLPVGISFYTFQTMSYTISVYLGTMRARSNIVDYLAYVSFFPQLVAGPIERATEFLPQFERERRFDYALAVDGCRQFLWGFFKKLVIADHLAPTVETVFSSIATQPGTNIAFATVCFAVQIYCDFSAYSDMAVGTGKLLGFQLMRNFAYPYFSQSVGEFWRRWHISLSTWFRDYVYIPLGGNRAGEWTAVRNIMTTFVISGLWHGASWNFVIWGAIMGLGVLPEILRTPRARLGSRDIPAGDTLVPGAWTVARMAFTFAIICFGWIFFRAATTADSFLAVQKIAVDLFDPSAYAALFELLAGKSRSALILMIALVAIEWIQRRHPHPLVLPNMPRWQRWSVYTAMLWITIFTGPSNNSQFIYFQF